MKVLKKIAWLINRFSLMQKREVLHRFEELINIFIAQLPYNNKAKRAYKSIVNYIDSNKLKSYKKFTNTCNWDDVLDNKSMLLNSHYKVQSFTWKFAGSKSWLECPDTNFSWSHEFFYKINYREGGDSGDVRVVWEASRLQQLIGLAYIAKNDKENTHRALKSYLIQFNSWFDNNPVYYGPHYISVMECALRIISICFASAVIEDEISDDSYWIKQSNVVTSHAEIILERLSLYSSSGNHTLTEASGLIFAGVLYSKHPRASTWLDIGQKLFCKEFMRQTNSDGSGIEQTSWYLKFIYDLAVITLPLIDSENSELLQARVDKVEQFLADISCDNKIISFGDSDDGYAVSRYLNFITKTPQKLEGYTYFKDSGLIKVKHKDTLVFFDCGNLGMGPGYGHGHADALSVDFYYKDVSILSDTGTGTYNSDEKIRTYFRSTQAHNTVVINKEDQSIQTSKFMWKSDISSELIKAETVTEGTYVLAKHSGYEERFDCIHYRGIFISISGVFFVWDYITGNADSIEAYWHFAENLDLSSSKLSTEGFTLNIGGLAKNFECYCDQVSIPLGIRSPIYGQIKECNTIIDKFESQTGHLTFFSENVMEVTEVNKIKAYFYNLVEKESE
jgi:hypothetical protein